MSGKVNHVGAACYPLACLSEHNLTKYFQSFVSVLSGTSRECENNSGFTEISHVLFSSSATEAQLHSTYLNSHELTKHHCLLSPSKIRLLGLLP